MEQKQIDICEELSQNFIDSSYEANSRRAFADARDGLKPGQRACLWEMYIKKYNSSKPHAKSAKISGAVAGNWWPHGDVAIYDTFTRMSQDWINNLPEVSWHGNNGNRIVPDAAAAARYTEARLSKVVEEGMFTGIDKKNVNMIPNYAEDDEWPEVLPAVLPRLMINGCQGIGSTIANVWLPHSLSEIGSVLIKYMQTGELDYSNLYPEFPTGGQIINKDSVSEIYKTGKGKVILRAIPEIKGDHILFTSLTYQTYLEPLADKIKTLALEGKINGVEAVYNRSSKKGLLLDIECNGDPERVLQQLYAKTDLQKNYNANQWALVSKTPRLLNLKEYCDIYIDHNIECVIRESKFDKAKAETRKEVVEGLLKALANIDDIIALIKKSASSTDAREQLIKIYNFTEVQAKAITNMKLGSLAKLEGIELNNELAQLIETIDKLNLIINNRDEQIKVIVARLMNLIKNFGKKRVTEVAQINIPKEEKEKEMIVPVDAVVVVTQSGDIKRISKNQFKVQKRNGKGVKTAKDAILTTISTNTVDTLLIFTDKGKMYRLLVDKIPEGTNVSKGVKLSTLISLDIDEKIEVISSIADSEKYKYVVFFTKNGLIKKTELSEYINTKKTTGIQAIKFKEGDNLANVDFLNEEEVVVITKNGMSIRFETNNINATGRASSGVKSISLKEGDSVLRGIVVKDETEHILLATSSGLCKKIKISDFVSQGRGGKGVICYKLATGTTVAGAAAVNNEDAVFVVGKPNSICVTVADVQESSKEAQGVKIISGSSIQAITRL